MAAVYRLSRPALAGKADIAVARAGMLTGFQSYLDRLMKMIPAEVVGLYLVGSGIIPSGQTTILKIALIAWTVICLIAVVVVRIYGTYDQTKQHPIDWPHVVISAIAFLIWVYTIGGGPFAALGLSIPWVGSLLVLVWTFFVPILYHGAD
jgi:hypothetical protein